MDISLYKTLLMQLPAAYACYKLIRDKKGKLTDFEFEEINTQFSLNSGLSSEALVGKIVTDPDDKSWMMEHVGALKPGHSFSDKIFCRSHHRWYLVYMFLGSEDHLAIIYNDITLEESTLQKHIKEKHQRDHFFQKILSIDHKEPNLFHFFRQIAQLGVEALINCSVSIWMQDENVQDLKCYDFLEADSHQHSQGLIIPGGGEKKFFHYLEQNGFIAISEVHGSTLLPEQVSYFLTGKGVGSVLLSSLNIKGDVKGFVMAGYPASGRQWGIDEIQFVRHLADHASEYFIAKELDQSQQQIHNLADSIPGAIFQFVTDSKGLFKLNYLSRMGEELFERNILELGNPYRLFDHVCSGQIANLYKSIKSSQDNISQWDHEFCIITPSGNKKWLHARAIPNPLPEGSVLWNGVFLDVTLQKNQEEALKQSSEKLIVAEKATEFKKNFFANMSHEMRTPLTGIIGTTDLLLNTRLDVQQKDFVNTIRISGENLRETINEILDYSKIEAGMARLNPVAFEASSIFEHAGKLFHSVCQKEITLDTYVDDTLPQYISADLNRINQILNNLVFNAVKFTPMGKIKLSAEREKLLSGDELMVKIKVTDTGIGIRPEAQKIIFEPFYQERFMGSSDTQHFEGTGLGLPICKELTSLMKGEIGVLSEPGYGSTFWFTFQAHRSQKPVETEKPAVSKDVNIPDKLRILLVEDKAVNQKVIKLILGSLGHIVNLATNGEEALQQFEPERFDLILMDIKMPVMDGITATQKLKEKYTQLPPIVGLSANAFEGDREKYMALGMDEYLTKPFKTIDFIDLVNKVLGERPS